MRSGRRTALAERPWQLSAKLLIASSIATVIGFSAICASVMLDMRRGEEALARQSLENLASSIDADISRNIEVYDLSLRAVASNMVMPEIKDVSKPILHLILFDHASLCTVSIGIASVTPSAETDWPQFVHAADKALYAAKAAGRNRCALAAPALLRAA
jgi:GGDEF domain-containing protein